MMQKSDFFFELPQGLIAQEPCEPRDAARLMCLARGTDTIEHRVFHDLPALLQAGDLLVINKIDIAQYVGSSLEVMERDSKKMRGDKPFLFTNVRGREGVDKVIEWIKSDVLFEEVK